MYVRKSVCVRTCEVESVCKDVCVRVCVYGRVNVRMCVCVCVCLIERERECVYHKPYHNSDLVPPSIHESIR